MAKYEIGDKVKVKPENNNETYDSFKNKTLRVTNVARNEREHPGFDNACLGEGLYDLETLDGESIDYSLYDWELTKV